MKSKQLIIILILISLWSCSFDKIFLNPTKVPIGVTSMTVNSADGSKIVTYFDTITFQPTFVKNEQDTLNFNYTIESFVFKSDNGNKLNGWLLKSKTKEVKKTIIYFHGNSGFMVSQYKLMTPFLEKGFQVFLFDYSGYGFSEGKAIRNNVLTDGVSFVNYVKTRPEIENTKLIIYGQSLGGHLSPVVASKFQDDIDALVIEGAFSSHDDIAIESAGFVGRVMVKEKYSARESIQDFRKPVLIIHSVDDATIPVSQGKTLYENANEPKSFYEITGRHIYGPLLFLDSIAMKIDRMVD